MQPFIPPSFSLPVAWTIDFSLPTLLRFVHNIDEVVIRPEDIQKLRSLRKERILYCSNHPTTAEPPISYEVAKAMGTRFHYMASRQVFDWGNGMVGKLIQSIGAYSVLAGHGDRESIKMSRAILSAPGGKLVVYPEGEPTSGENDTILPLQSGVAQIGFWGLEDARKKNPQADVTVITAFVKYIYNGTQASILGDLHSALRRIERKLKIDPENRNLLRRFLTVGRVMLEEAEKYYKIAPGSETDWDYRVGRIRHAILDNIADRFEIQGYNYKADAIEKLRFLISVHEMVVVEFPDPRLPEMNKDEQQWVFDECMKAYLFIVTRPLYLIEKPTAERFYEWLARYESYVFNTTRPRSRKAYVSFAEPFELGAYLERYKKNRRATVEEVTARVKKNLEQLRDESLNLSEPVVRPLDLGPEPLSKSDELIRTKQDKKFRK